MRHPYLAGLAGLAGIIAISSLCTPGCMSHGGTAPEGPADLGAGIAPGCGNGIVDDGEACDTAIPPGRLGACPQACPSDGDPCVKITLVGEGCLQRCERKEITTPINGDGCCPPGQTQATDSDCRLVNLVGPEQTVCSLSGKRFQVPTLSAGGDHFAVGCVPDGAAEEDMPVVKVLDKQGAVVKADTLLQTDGHDYTEIQTAFNDNRFQVLYSYNCSTSGNWQVGRSWSCIDFREYDLGGALVTPSLRYGQPGYNRHPSLSFGAAGFGTAWVSGNAVYFRLIDKERKLVGGVPEDNLMVGHDLWASNDSNLGRARIAWDGSGFGVFAIIGTQLNFARVAEGKVVVPLRPIGPGSSQITGGHFAVLHDGGVYFVLYGNPDTKKTVFLQVGLDGKAQGSTPVQDGEFVYASMFEKAGLFYAFSNDAGMMGQVTVLDRTGVIKETSKLDPGHPMLYPVAAYDAGTGNAAAAYLDSAGTVKLQRLHLGP